MLGDLESNVTSVANFKGIDVFELLAYMGGMWFFVTKIFSVVLNTSSKTLDYEIQSLGGKRSLDMEEGEKLSN